MRSQFPTIDLIFFKMTDYLFCQSVNDLWSLNPKVDTGSLDHWHLVSIYLKLEHENIKLNWLSYRAHLHSSSQNNDWPREWWLKCDHCLSWPSVESGRLWQCTHDESRAQTFLATAENNAIPVQKEKINCVISDQGT